VWILFDVCKIQEGTTPTKGKWIFYFNLFVLSILNSDFLNYIKCKSNEKQPKTTTHVMHI